ncbi:protein CURVATURE THYLAKOID 1B, chloroplastic-like [Nymphaea colorata]|nr:protein CURVATURE THYLAKOID 1B, chloroplastic-like [Nymphaea colorata]
MASSTAAIAVPPSSALIDGKSGRPQVAAPPQCLPSLTPSPIRLQGWKSMASGRRMSRSTVVMATGEPPAEAGTDISSITKPIQEAWDKIDDKYAVASLTLAGLIAIWGSTGLISAIERLPVVPGVLELVGIGYTGWFIYRNLVFKPDREALFDKIKGSYDEITGSN